MKACFPFFLLLFILCNFFSCSMQKEFQQIVQEDFKMNNPANTELLTEKDLSHLPAPVKKYLLYTKSVGKPKIKNFRAEFTGKMRSNPTDDYMQLESVQYNFYQKPSRFFYMVARKMGLPATGLHLYKNASATFQVKLMGLFTIIDAKGEKMNQAETVTLFNDMCFIAPASLIDKKIQWKLMNEKTVQGIYTNGNITISAVLYFNEKGELVNFISNDRFHTDGEKYENYPWETPVDSYRETNGYILPSRAKLIYQRPEGNFIYGELEYKSVKYNLEESKED